MKNVTIKELKGFYNLTARYEFDGSKSVIEVTDEDGEVFYTASFMNSFKMVLVQKEVILSSFTIDTDKEKVLEFFDNLYEEFLEIAFLKEEKFLKRQVQNYLDNGLYTASSFVAEKLKRIEMTKLKYNL